MIRSLPVISELRERLSSTYPEIKHHYRDYSFFPDQKDILDVSIELLITSGNGGFSSYKYGVINANISRNDIKAVISASILNKAGLWEVKVPIEDKDSHIFYGLTEEGRQFYRNYEKQNEKRVRYEREKGLRKGLSYEEICEVIE